MKKQIKSLAVVATLTLGMTLLSGCGKEKAMKPEAMIDKYSAMCTLGEYKGVEYTHTKTEVTDDMINQQVDNLLSSFATTEDVTTGAVMSGDTVNIDFAGTVDGVAFDGGTSQGYELKLGSSSMIPGFEEGIIGHSVGETFDIDVTFPDSYPNNPDLAGVPAVFNITINSATRSVNPEYTDEFVASNTDAASKEEYEANTRKSLEEYYEGTDKSSNRNSIMTKIIEKSKIAEYPEQEMQKLVDDTVSSVEKEAKTYGYDLATYVVNVYGMESEDAFVSYISSMVEDFLKEKIVVCAIAKAENMTVSDDDIAAAETMIMDAYGIESKDTLYENYTKDDVTYYAIAEKVFNFVLENGKPVEEE